MSDNKIPFDSLPRLHVAAVLKKVNFKTAVKFAKSNKKILEEIERIHPNFDKLPQKRHEKAKAEREDDIKFHRERPESLNEDIWRRKILKESRITYNRTIRNIFEACWWRNNRLQTETE